MCVQMRTRDIRHRHRMSESLAQMDHGTGLLDSILSLIIVDFFIIEHIPETIYV